MQICAVEYTQNKSHVEAERSTKIAVEGINNINKLWDFTKTQNMHNSAFRYKLDTSDKICKVLIYKEKKHI